MLGTNPDGESVWLSIQAPFGYVKINENAFWDALKQELGKVKFESPNAAGITKELESASIKAMKLCAQVIGDHAPVDKGPLSKSFKVIEPGDSLLDDSDDNRTLIIGGE